MIDVFIPEWANPIHMRQTAAWVAGDKEIGEGSFAPSFALLFVNAEGQQKMVQTGLNCDPTMAMWTAINSGALSEEDVRAVCQPDQDTGDTEAVA